MDVQTNFEVILTAVCMRLTSEAKQAPFQSASQFERRVREVLQVHVNPGHGFEVDFEPPPQAFPDIDLGEFGVEVKFTLSDTWRSVANSVLETNRIETVKQIYLVFGKMGGVPEVRWAPYDKSVIHVRTSHVPRFEVDMASSRSLFEQMGISYEDFRRLPMQEKMQHIRLYARGRLKKGERLWWLDESSEASHALPIQARLYTGLEMTEKTQLRAEAALLCPEIVAKANVKGKYDNVVLYLLTYHGVICHQARDLFSAGSVANPHDDDEGGVYIQRALTLIQKEMQNAAERIEDALFEEYWGESVPKDRRIRRWLERADKIATDWKPSEVLFTNVLKVKSQVEI